MARGIRTAWVFGVAGLLLASVGVVGAQMLRADAQHGSSDDAHLTQAQYDAAVLIARHQVHRLHPRLTSASAIVARGTVTQANLSGSCTSGSVIKIRLAGHGFHVLTGGRLHPDGDGSGKGDKVTTVEVTADAVSRRPCLIEVVTGPPLSPYRDGDDLLPALAR
jgi:hypothetical protein